LFPVLDLSLFFFFYDFYLFILERERVGGGAEGEEPADCALSAEPDEGLDPRTLT